MSIVTGTSLDVSPELCDRRHIRSVFAALTERTTNEQPDEAARGPEGKGAGVAVGHERSAIAPSDDEGRHHAVRAGQA